MRKIFWYSLSTALFVVFTCAMFGGMLSLFVLYDFYAKDIMPARGVEQTWYTAAWLIGCIPLRQIIIATCSLGDGTTNTTEKTHVHAQKKEKISRPYSKG